MLSAALPDVGRPVDSSGAAWRAWLGRPDVRAAAAASRSYAFTSGVDGNFRIEGVEPGDYWFDLRFGERGILGLEKCRSGSWGLIECG